VSSGFVYQVVATYVNDRGWVIEERTLVQGTAPMARFWGRAAINAATNESAQHILFPINAGGIAEGFAKFEALARSFARELLEKQNGPSGEVGSGETGSAEAEP
jgi:hypothetical protein